MKKSKFTESQIAFAVQQANVALTIRNWVIVFYVVEYEQEGEDRAESLDFADTVSRIATHKFSAPKFAIQFAKNRCFCELAHPLLYTTKPSSPISRSACPAERSEAPKGEAR